MNASAEAYLEVLRGVTSATQTQSGQTRQDYVQAWSELRTARIYHIPQSIYSEIHNWVDKFTTEKIAGFPWQSSAGPPEGESAQYAQAVSMAAGRVPFPSPLPFDRVFLGFGEGVMMTESGMYSRFGKQASQLSSATLLGVLLTDTGKAYEFLSLTLNSGQFAFSMLISCSDGGWVRSLDLCPWTFNLLVNTITQHSVITEGDSTEFRKEYRKQKKLIGLKKMALPLPPPYYEVKLRNINLRTECLKTLGGSHFWVLDHQIEVAGHDKFKIQRGPLPIEDNLKAKLLKRGYLFFDHGLNSAELRILQGLQRRGILEPASNEWIAIKTAHVDPYKKGPIDGPLIPAVRVASKRPPRSAIPKVETQT